MSEETDDFEDYLRNKLKTIDVQTLEATIAKAVGELVALEFKCYIEKIEYGTGLSRQGAKFEVSLSEPVKSVFGQTDSPTQES